MTNVESQSQRVLVASPYAEGSCLAIARELSRRDQLAAYVTTFVPPPWLGIGVRRFPRAAALLDRKIITGVPRGKIQAAGTAAELVHLTLRRSPRTVRLASQSMYWSKGHFDRVIAHQLLSGSSGGEVDQVLGMYGSSAATFRAAKARGVSTVLNFVNSEPSTQNQLLRKFAGLGDGHYELISPSVQARVADEIAMADRILVPSVFVADQLRRLGVSHDRIATVPYGVDLARFSNRPKAVKTDSGPLLVLFVGQISHRKGIRTLLDAARAMGARVRLQLVGPVTSRELLLNLPPNTTYLGTSPHGGLPALMREADLLALPSYEDAFPLVVLEAMGCGTPAVVTRNVGSAEIIEPGVTGYVIPPADVAALTAVFSQLHGDAATLAKVSNRAREAVIRHGDWEAYGRTIVDMMRVSQ